jgi:hypothetical protein
LEPHCSKADGEYEEWEEFSPRAGSLRVGVALHAITAMQRITEPRWSNGDGISIGHGWYWTESALDRRYCKRADG